MKPRWLISAIADGSVPVRHSGCRGAAAFLLIALWLLAFCSAAALAQEFPPLTGRVVDNANLLAEPEQQALSGLLANLEKQSGRQVVVVTVPSLQGYAIEDYGYRLGRHWGIGQRERDDGVLLLVAPQERRVRIEVGYGLEPVLTDALAAMIISREILPHFRRNDYAAGIVAGTRSIVQQLTLPEDEARARAAEARQEAESSAGDTPSLLFWLLFFGVFILPTMMSFLGGGRGGRRGPMIIWGPGRGGRRGGFGGSGFSGGGGGFGGGGSSGSW